MKSRQAEPCVVLQLNQIAQILSAPGCGSPGSQFWVVEAPENHIPFLPSFPFLLLFNIYLLCVYPYLLYLVCGSQRTTCRGVSPYIIWVPGIELGSSYWWQLCLPAEPLLDPNMTSYIKWSFEVGGGGACL